MKTYFNIYGRVAAIAVILATVACTKPEAAQQGGTEQEEQPGQETPAAEQLGSYIYNGKEYPVHSIAYAENAISLMVRISPKGPEEDLTTYAVIGIASALDGETIDVDRQWHNDDYYFIYEDPVKYYSQYRKLKSGTIRIAKSGNNFRISADVVLPDDADFKFEYEGVIDPVME